MAGLFGGKSSAPAVPAVEEPTRMPDPQDPRVLEAERRRVELMRMRGGRLSTILSDTLQNAFRQPQSKQARTVLGAGLAGTLGGSAGTTTGGTAPGVPGGPR